MPQLQKKHFSAGFRTSESSSEDSRKPSVSLQHGLPRSTLFLSTVTMTAMQRFDILRLSYLFCSAAAAVVFDDIHWSRGMTRAWNILRTDSRVAFFFRPQSSGNNLPSSQAIKPKHTHPTKKIRYKKHDISQQLSHCYLLRFYFKLQYRRPGQVGIIVNMTGTQRVRVRIPHHIRLDIRESDPTACLRISNICTNRKMDSYPGRKEVWPMKKYRSNTVEGLVRFMSKFQDRPDGKFHSRFFTNIARDDLTR